jgi:hypothetical protein
MAMGSCLEMAATAARVREQVFVAIVSETSSPSPLWMVTFRCSDQNLQNCRPANRNEKPKRHPDCFLRGRNCACRLRKGQLAKFSRDRKPPLGRSGPDIPRGAHRHEAPRNIRRPENRRGPAPRRWRLILILRGESQRPASMSGRVHACLKSQSDCEAPKTDRSLQ